MPTGFQDEALARKLASDAQTVIGELSPHILKTAAAKNPQLAATGLASEYLKRAMGLNQSKIDNADEDDYKNYL